MNWEQYPVYYHCERQCVFNIIVYEYYHAPEPLCGARNRRVIEYAREPASGSPKLAILLSVNIPRTIVRYFFLVQYVAVCVYGKRIQRLGDFFFRSRRCFFFIDRRSRCEGKNRRHCAVLVNEPDLFAFAVQICCQSFIFRYFLFVMLIKFVIHASFFHYFNVLSREGCLDGNPF